MGIKTAHYAGPEFLPVERAVEAGTIADIPVMVDFGQAQHDRSLADLLGSKLRPGDIYTHVYSGLRGELDADGHANQALSIGRRRGVLLDVGHGGGSFTWRVAVPSVVMALALRFGRGFAGDWLDMGTIQRVASLAVLVGGGAAVYFLACFLVGLRVSDLRMKPEA